MSAAETSAAAAFDAPLFIAQGLEDELVEPADTRDLAAHRVVPG